MANRFEMTADFIHDLQSYRDETTPLGKVLECAQNSLFQQYLARRKAPFSGYRETAVSPFVRLRLFVADGRFVLDGIDAYRQGYRRPAAGVPEGVVAADVSDLLSADAHAYPDDELSAGLAALPALTDWFRRFLAAIPAVDRAAIRLRGAAMKQLAAALADEKRNLEREERAAASDEEQVGPPSEERAAPPNEEETVSQNAERRAPRAIVDKRASFVRRDDWEEKRLREAQRHATALSERIAKRIGIHFGWEEIFIQGQNGDAMLTCLERKIRKKGLRQEDEDWIIVVGYRVEDGDFELIRDHYPRHVYRSDDLLHRPSPEYVALALIVTPWETLPPSDDGVRRVVSKGAKIRCAAPETVYLEPEEGEERLSGGGTLRKVVVKTAAVPHFEAPRGSFVPEEAEEPPAEPEPLVIPKRWKCPLCRSKNPWHTEAPGRIVEKRDGSVVFLCAKHRNAAID